MKYRTDWIPLHCWCYSDKEEDDILDTDIWNKQIVCGVLQDLTEGLAEPIE